MLLGALISRLENERDASDTLEALGDLVLYAEVATAAAAFDESPGEYLAASVGHFASAADDEAWMGLVGAMERAEDPGRGAYITNVLPWRPPGNRTPTGEEIAMMLPFLERHVALAAPGVLVLMGNTPCRALLGRDGITRVRGTWTEALGLPVLPMFHPAYLLRQPAAKREAWADLLRLKARLGL